MVFKKTHHITAVLVGDNINDFDDWKFVEPQMKKGKENKEMYDSMLIRELRNSILNEQDPVQRTLGLAELDNPSIQKYEGVQDRAINHEEFGLIKYKALIDNDRIGIDFMTNQPKYKQRETIVG